MNINAEKIDENREILRFKGLSGEAKKELLKYYEFLLFKYREEKPGMFITILSKELKN